jgi:hypothetical protein
MVRGVTPRARAAFAAAFVVAELGIILATRAYTEGRRSVWNVELLVPMLLGALPGALAYVVASKALSSEGEPR